MKFLHLPIQNYVLYTALGIVLSTVQSFDEASAASLSATATVVSTTRFLGMQTKNSIVITEKDVKNGYVEVQDAAQFEIRSSATRFMLAIEDTSGIAEAMTVFIGTYNAAHEDHSASQKNPAESKIPGAETELPGTGGLIDLSSKQFDRQKIKITCKLQLLPATKAGEYPWAITFTPVAR